MNAREPVESWQERDSEPLTVREHPIRLSVCDAARLAALADLFPSRGVEGLVRDLLGAALDEVEQALASAATGPIVSETDEGDPLDEQSGPAVRYRSLCEHYTALLAAEAGRDVMP
jgi:hypothetical protein